MTKYILHKSIRWMVVAFGATAILSGCTQNEEELTDNSPLLIGTETEASRTATSLGDKYSDFGVWAWKTNSDNSQSLVLGRKPTAEQYSEYYTRLEDDKWTYEYSDGTATQYIRYWDRAATNYYFSAYAPYKKGDNLLNSSHTITATADGVNISAISGNISDEKGIDWLVASWQRQVSPTLIDKDLIANQEHTTTNLTDILPLAFHHILALTEFRIYSGTDAAVTLSDLSISLSDAIYTTAGYNAGSWMLDNSSTATNLFSSPNPLNVAGTNKENSISLTTLLQIPQAVKERTINVNITVGEETHSGSFSLPEDWQGEKIYIYYLCIKGNESSPEEIILMDFKVEDWKSGGDITISDPIVNW